MHIVKSDPAMTSYAPAESESMREKNSVVHSKRTVRIPRSTWMRIAEYAYEENCSIEEAFARVVERSTHSDQTETQAASEPEEEEGARETAMDKLRQMQARLNGSSKAGFSREGAGNEGANSTTDTSSSLNDAKSRLQRAKACLDNLSTQQEAYSTALEEKEAAQDTRSSINFGKMVSGYDTLVGSESPANVGDAKKNGQTASTSGRDSKSEEGVENPYECPPCKRADQTRSMFDIARGARG